jgi:hypothetical protein
MVMAVDRIVSASEYTERVTHLDVENSIQSNKLHQIVGKELSYPTHEYFFHYVVGTRTTFRVPSRYVRTLAWS